MRDLRDLAAVVAEVHAEFRERLADLKRAEESLKMAAKERAELVHMLRSLADSLEEPVRETQDATVEDYKAAGFRFSGEPR